MAKAAEPAASADVLFGAPGAAWRPYQMFLLGVLLLVAMSSYLDRQIMSLLQEAIKKDLLLSDWELGLVSGPAFALLHSIAGLPMARLAERMNRPRLLSAAIVVWSTMTAFCALATNFVMLGLGRMGVGMGEGGCNPICHALVADNFSVRQRGKAMAVLSAASPLAAIFAPLIAGAVALTWGWRAAFVVVGLPGLLLAVLVWFTLKEPRAARTADSPPARSFATDLKWLLGNRAFVFVFLAGAFQGIGVQGTGIFTASFVMRAYHLNIAEAGGILSFRGLASLGATALGGYLADRFAGPRGRSYVLVPCMGAALAFSFFFWAVTATHAVISIGLLMAGACAAELKNGPNFAAIQNMVPSHMRSTAVAVFFLAATVVGTAVGASLVGGISDMTAARVFPANLGDYAAFCPGGRSIASAGPAAAAACATASAEGLRTALAAISFAFLGSSICFFLASRKITINTD